jgi:hypothetical protein
MHNYFNLVLSYSAAVKSVTMGSVSVVTFVLLTLLGGCFADWNGMFGINHAPPSTYRFILYTAMRF